MLPPCPPSGRDDPGLLARPRAGTTRGYLPIFSVSPKYAHCASRRLRTEDPSLSRLVQSHPDPFACVVPGRASCVNWPFCGVQLTQLDVLHARAHQIADALRQIRLNQSFEMDETSIVPVGCLSKFGWRNDHGIQSNGRATRPPIPDVNRRRRRIPARISPPRPAQSQRYHQEE